MKNNILTCPAEWLESKINIVMVGAGGTGSNVLDALMSLHLGLLGVGHPHGIKVTLIDNDIVELPNIGRQRFTHCDIGNNKAQTLINRYNIAFNLNWKAEPIFFEPDEYFDYESYPDLLISCVDTPASRSAIGQYFKHQEIHHHDSLWMDFGNGDTTGQVVLGHISHPNNILPNVFDLYPELSSMEDDNKPSCSLEEAIQNQDLYINRTLADAGVNLLWQLLRKGSIDHHGVFLNLTTSELKPLKIDPEIWSFMGYERTELDEISDSE